MSSHPYVTQQNTPLADDTTLMSTTDLQSYITHANDTFVQVSGYTLQELQGQPHNMVRHPDMPKAAFADMWFTLKKGEPWSGIVKNRRKNGDHYWVRANACAVLDEAACALARLAATVAGQLDADGLPVALTGGVARMGELFTGRFRRALEHLVPQCVYQPAKYSPVVGAALCVLSESAGVDITAPGVAENLMKEKMGEAHVDG